MKDLVDIRDFLVESRELGDWDGEEETVADNLNELLHYCFGLLPDDMPVEAIESALAGIWDRLRGDTAILDADMAELYDFIDSYVNTLNHDDQ